MSIQDIL